MITDEEIITYLRDVFGWTCDNVYEEIERLGYEWGELSKFISENGYWKDCVAYIYGAA